MQVCSNWVGLAVSLQLGHLVSDIARTSSSNVKNRDRHKLSKLICHWQTDKPKLFTVDTLLSVLRRLNMTDMEMWIRIITSRHYQHIRQEINNRRQRTEYLKYRKWLSYDSLNSGSIMNISQDSGVGDMNYSANSHSLSAHNVSEDCADYKEIFHRRSAQSCQSTLTSLETKQNPKPGGKCCNFSLNNAKKGSVFQILFNPEGKALIRISDAWIEKMKKKKRSYRKIHKSHENVTESNICNMNKYFDNLATILHHSASCIGVQTQLSLLFISHYFYEKVYPERQKKNIQIFTIFHFHL